MLTIALLIVALVLVILALVLKDWRLAAAGLLALIAVIFLKYGVNRSSGLGLESKKSVATYTYHGKN